MARTRPHTLRALRSLLRRTQQETEKPSRNQNRSDTMLSQLSQLRSNAEKLCSRLQGGIETNKDTDSNGVETETTTDIDLSTRSIASEGVFSPGPLEHESLDSLDRSDRTNECTDEEISTPSGLSLFSAPWFNGGKGTGSVEETKDPQLWNTLEQIRATRAELNRIKQSFKQGNRRRREEIGGWKMKKNQCNRDLWLALQKNRRFGLNEYKETLLAHSPPNQATSPSVLIAEAKLLRAQINSHIADHQLKVVYAHHQAMIDYLYTTALPSVKDEEELATMVGQAQVDKMRRSKDEMIDLFEGCLTLQRKIMAKYKMRAIEQSGAMSGAEILEGGESSRPVLDEGEIELIRMAAEEIPVMQRDPELRDSAKERLKERRELQAKRKARRQARETEYRNCVQKVDQLEKDSMDRANKYMSQLSICGSDAMSVTSLDRMSDYGDEDYSLPLKRPSKVNKINDGDNDETRQSFKGSIRNSIVDQGSHSFGSDKEWPLDQPLNNSVDSWSDAASLESSNLTSIQGETSRVYHSPNGSSGEISPMQSPKELQVENSRESASPHRFVASDSTPSHTTSRGSAHQRTGKHREGIPDGITLVVAGKRGDHPHSLSHHPSRQKGIQLDSSPPKGIQRRRSGVSPVIQQVCSGDDFSTSGASLDGDRSLGGSVTSSENRMRRISSLRPSQRRSRRNLLERARSARSIASSGSSVGSNGTASSGSLRRSCVSNRSSSSRRLNSQRPSLSKSEHRPATTQRSNRSGLGIGSDHTTSTASTSGRNEARMERLASRRRLSEKDSAVASNGSQESRPRRTSSKVSEKKMQEIRSRRLAAKSGCIAASLVTR